MEKRGLTSVLLILVAAMVLGQDIPWRDLVQKHDYARLETELRQVPDPGSVEIYGEKLLLYATRVAADPRLVTILLKRGVDPNIQSTTSGFTPLMYAVEKPQGLELVRLLAEAGADLQKGADLGFGIISPLELAAGNSNLEILKYLRSRGVRFDPKDGPSAAAFLRACGSNPQPQAIDYFLSNGFPVNYRDRGGFTPLMQAVLGNRRENILLLLDHGANVNAANTLGSTPLILACWYQVDYPVSELLLARGADTRARDRNGTDALGFAIITDKVAIVEELLRLGLGSGPAPRGFTGLHSAAGEGKSIPILALLADASTDLNAADDFGLTPLMYAARSNKIPAQKVKFLLEKGARIEGQDKKGRTAFDYAKANAGVPEDLCEALLPVSRPRPEGLLP